MDFKLSARSDSFQASVYQFPEDEAIPADVYRKAIFNGYLTSVPTIYGAARSLGLDIDAETFERWKRLGAAAGLADDFLDHASDLSTARDTYTYGLSEALLDSTSATPPDWANSAIEPAVRLLRNSVAGLPEQQVAVMAAAARAIGAIALDKAASEDVGDYIDLIKLEAYHSSFLIHSAASPNVQSQPKFQKFARWCVYAIQLGGLVDSSWDLWSDKKHRLTSVDASLRNSLRIFRRTRTPIRAMIHPGHNRQATLAAIRARIEFSKIPTALLIKRP